MNGNRDGTRLLTHRASEVFIYSIEVLGEMMRRTNIMHANTVGKIIFAEVRRDFSVLYIIFISPCVFYQVNFIFGWGQI